MTAADGTGWRTLAEGSPAAVLSGTVVLWASLAAHELAGAAPGTLAGRDALELLSGADRPRARLALEFARDHPGEVHHPLRVRLAAPPGRRLEVTARPLDGDRVAVAAWDVTDRLRRERELRHRAGHDALTGLPNRALLADRWEVSRARAVSTPGRGTFVLVCDVDGLKRVNDEQGHAAGDRLLVDVARALSAHVRPGDTVARTGGDEFVVLVEQVAAGHVEELAVRLRGDAPSGAGRGVRVSVGWAADGPGRSPESVLAEADARMYADKRAARERAVPAPRGAEGEGEGEGEPTGPVRSAGP
ncbi:GGDEF domain-containing protein [Paenibacillus sp. TRM 82003]|uniref:sensor domain-containing diguanylate cyclase n=1 Tax=Kineococcus sp. TRM81007 TaxID=2925831 RepID=UPI001F577D22|nr:sensor domain-containing diguanylate cyclase [Kineococcus sp. TRM81007]MCI2237493.1 GGDEF domain-containing protein [Kineococcus sp. TRM81007]MCI3919846.1 GGDEF domain-containing protein [Paenibacillus sp. TRM 82003]